MKNFFSAVQGKFSAKYHGRYLGHILEQIAYFRPDVMLPLVRSAGLGKGRRIKAEELSVTTEFMYLNEIIGENGREIAKEEPLTPSGMVQNKDRLADLRVDVESDSAPATLLVEIKVNDPFLDGQLQDYIAWLEDGKSQGHEVRGVIILTAYPLEIDAEKEIVRARKKGLSIQHVYLSSYLEDIRKLRQSSELISMFCDYLYDEGYAMYHINEEERDYEALHSFLVLNFLPHNSGHKKVSSSKKVARGPAVFSHVVQNWQLVSDRFAKAYLKSSRRPTVRYFPEQGGRGIQGDMAEVSDDGILQIRRSARNEKVSGRFWLTADIILNAASSKDAELGEDVDQEDSVSSRQIRLEWGQILHIEKGKGAANDEVPIKCTIYAFIRAGMEQLGGAKIVFKGGVLDSRLYGVENFMKELKKVVSVAYKNSLKKRKDLPKIDFFDE